MVIDDLRDLENMVLSVHDEVQNELHDDKKREFLEEVTKLIISKYRHEKNKEESIWVT